MVRVAPIIFLGLLLLLSAPLAFSASDLEGFDDHDSGAVHQHQRQAALDDDDEPHAPSGTVASEASHEHEDEGDDVDVGSPSVSAPSATLDPSSVPSSAAAGGAASKPAAAKKGSHPLQGAAIENIQMEILAGSILVLFIINYLMGRRRNMALAKAWEQHFIAPGSIFEKNFAQLGTGLGSEDDVLSRESPSCYRFYATGRRYCQSLLATLNLQARQDLRSVLWGLLSPSEDTLEVEVLMSESTMPQMVLVVAVPRLARAMLADLPEVRTYAKKIGVPSEVTNAGWPTQRLHVLAEHSSLFTDLVAADPRVTALFGSSALKYFRSMVLTSENPQGNRPRVLKFTFALPPPSDMAALAPLVSLVPFMIDAVGQYRMPADLKKKASDARSKVAAAAEEVRKAQADRLEAKRLAKAMAEKEKILRMSPAQRQKYEEKMASKQQRKQMKMKMVR